MTSALIPRLRHALRHGAPHAAQRLEGAVRGTGSGNRARGGGGAGGKCAADAGYAADAGQAVGRRRPVHGARYIGVAQDIVEGDQSVAPAALDCREIHVQALRKCARRRHGSRASVMAAVARAADGDRFHEFLLAGCGHAADDGSGIELDERCTRGNDVAGRAPQGGHDAAERRRHFDHRFGRFDRDHGLVDPHMIAHLDVPLDDLGLGQALAQIRKPECAHEDSL